MNEILRQKLEEMADASINEAFLSEAWTDKTEDIPKYADAMGYVKPRPDGEIADQIRDDDGHEADSAEVKAKSHGDKSKQTKEKSPENKNTTPADKSKELQPLRSL
jgi:hypothetical protein